MYLYSDEIRQNLLYFKLYDELKDFDADKEIYFSILKEVENKGFDGLTLKFKKSDQWAVITPDPDYVCRYTCFDARGFFCHSSYQSYLKAFNDAFQIGYKILCSPDTLDRVASNWNTR